MFTSRILRNSILTIAALAGLACSNPTGPSSYKPKVLPQAAGVQPSYSRYILISGVWVCVDCEKQGQ